MLVALWVMAAAGQAARADVLAYNVGQYSHAFSDSNSRRAWHIAPATVTFADIAASNSAYNLYTIAALGGFNDVSSFTALSNAGLGDGNAGPYTTFGYAGADWQVINVGTPATSVTAVPEPEVYAMMLAGLALMGFVAGRRKQHISAYT